MISLLEIADEIVLLAFAQNREFLIKRFTAADRRHRIRDLFAVDLDRPPAIHSRPSRLLFAMPVATSTSSNGCLSSIVKPRHIGNALLQLLHGQILEVAAEQRLRDFNRGVVRFFAMNERNDFLRQRLMRFTQMRFRPVLFFQRFDFLPA